MGATEPQRMRRPNRLLLAAEGPRALGELALMQVARPLLARAPRGDGHTVLVLPGMGADDRSTVPLRRFLGGLGYDVHGWGLGTNMPSPALGPRLRERVARLRAETSGAASLVGWSLGGVYARRIARSEPDAVRLVVTLGSPLRGVPGHESHAAPLARAAARSAGRQVPRPWWPAEDGPLPVPSTSVFSRTDGVVPWQSCIDAAPGPHETLEVVGSHCGMGHHPAVLLVVADRLAQAPGRWQPMKVPPALRPVLRHHDQGSAAAAT
ncbi:MAG TPA: alpha/beta hydrolase [Acidimicrobiales bacterium]|nr:alpha/beta hydrolase [Acidimicrobiales bacterium]